MSRRNITDEFKAEAVQLVVAQGYSFSKACEALGVGDTALRRWVAQWRAEQAEPPRTEIQVKADQRRIRELEARVIELEREREILKKFHGLLRQGNGSLIEVIHSLKKAWPVSVMCELLKVPRSSYYAVSTRPARVAAAPALLKAVREIHGESRASYGSRRMAQALQQRGHAIGRYRARSLMREAQLAVARRRTHRYRKTDGEALVAPNLLERRFEPSSINQVWAGDITYVRTLQGWSYLAIVMDLYSRRIVGWAFAQLPDTVLVIRALQQAREHRRPPPGLMFHSDQGCQYTSAHFVNELKANGIIQSMSRKGNCWDNAPVERFFRSLKSEWIDDKGYPDHAYAERDIGAYIDDFYNYRRIHSAADGLPPARCEAALF
ncbi:IS3 family transposase [Paraburkholderia fungorum]|uniref:IS3 family transposase n=2 Tax=Paraburkholderia fungorum TaxID=134537 RepID=UPI00217D416C|nr:IS3 family transposase [Paraburkholderia fungorum]